jgi:hypothetical protein
VKSEDGLPNSQLRRSRGGRCAPASEERGMFWWTGPAQQWQVEFAHAITNADWDGPPPSGTVTTQRNAPEQPEQQTYAANRWVPHVGAVLLSWAARRQLSHGLEAGLVGPRDQFCSFYFLLFSFSLFSQFRDLF